MRSLLNKEIRLSVSLITWCFLAFSLMTFVPGYPIALGAFFICMGVFESFKKARESQDILYSALLPIAKRDVVTAKFAITLLVEGIGLLAMSAFSIVRMTVLADQPVYLQNALMPANLSFIACVLLVYAAFNFLFLRGFFKTAHYFGKPFLAFAVAAMLVVLLFEVAWHIPGLGALGSVLPSALQVVVLLTSAVAFALATFASLRISQRSFEAIDIS